MTDYTADTSVTDAERAAIFAEFQTVMDVDCAWCKKDLGQKPGYGQTGKTSGICPDCMESLLGEVLQ